MAGNITPTKASLTPPPPFLSLSQESVSCTCQYVCDSNNHRIQVFDLDLNFIRSIGSCGSGRGEFDKPHGNMYVADEGNGRVQVMDSSGRFIREFGRGKLRGPSGLLIADKYVYVSDFSGNCIVVYETSGQYVTSFGRPGQHEGEFRRPFCITSCVDGFIHVCDHGNDRVQFCIIILSTLFTIMIMTSSVMIMLPVQQHV